MFILWVCLTGHFKSFLIFLLVVKFVWLSGKQVFLVTNSIFLKRYDLSYVRKKLFEKLIGNWNVSLLNYKYWVKLAVHIIEKYKMTKQII